MRDDFLSGDWAANHTKLSDSIDKLAEHVTRVFGDTFAALARQQFDAPWAVMTCSDDKKLRFS